MITPEMIGLDQEGNIKVWIHQNFALNKKQFEHQPNTEREMLADIISVLTPYLVNDSSLNDMIKIVLK